MLKKYLLNDAKLSNYKNIVLTAKKLKIIIKIIIKTGSLSQFKLIKILLYNKV